MLEGPEETTNALYERIRQDKRHEQVRLIAREPMTYQMFEDWAMAAFSLEDLEQCSPAERNSPAQVELYFLIEHMISVGIENFTDDTSLKVLSDLLCGSAKRHYDRLKRTAASH